MKHGLQHYFTTHKGIVFNVLFAGYAVLIQRVVSSGLSSTVGTRETMPGLACLVFAFSMAEAVALRAKMRHVLRMDDVGKITANRVTVFFLPPLFFRLLLGFVLAAAMSYFLVPDVREKTLLAYVTLAMVAVLILKELYVLFGSLFLLLHPVPKALSPAKDGLCDFVLLSFSCAAYTILTYRGFMFTVRPSRDIFTTTLIVIMFVWGLLSVRVAYLLEEYLKPSSIVEKAFIVLTTLIASACASMPFFRG